MRSYVSNASVLKPDSAPAPREFRSKQIVRMFGVSLRNLQWWDERKIISPYHDGHSRVYSEHETLMIGILSELRAKGLSLQSFRKMFRALNAEIAKHRLHPSSPESLFLMVKPCVMVKEGDHAPARYDPRRGGIFRLVNPLDALFEASNAQGSVIVVALDPLIVKIAEYQDPKPKVRKRVW